METVNLVTLENYSNKVWKEEVKVLPFYYHQRIYSADEGYHKVYMNKYGVIKDVCIIKSLLENNYYVFKFNVVENQTIKTYLQPYYSTLIEIHKIDFESVYKEFMNNVKFNAEVNE